MTTMMRMQLFLAALSFFLAVPSWAQEAHRLSANPTPNVTVPVQTIRGITIGCVLISTPNTRALTGLRGVHAVGCVDDSGEVIVAVLRKNGTLFCSGLGDVDPNNTNCATVTGNCPSSTNYYCLF